MVTTICFHAKILNARIIGKIEVPHYTIDVSYDHDKTLLAGKMQVRFTRSSYPENELLFSLPGNRFLAQDERGIRKHKIVPVFSLRRFQDNFEDPKTPKGFSHGSMSIVSVKTLNNHSPNEKRDLQFSLESNPDLEVGYSIDQGLLRISLPEKLPDIKAYPGQSIVFINFYTKFPEHTQEGTVNGMLLTANWHPRLLSWDNHNTLTEKIWSKEERNTSPATYKVKWEAVQAGTIITSSGHQSLPPETSFTFYETKKTLKYFPLIFSKVHKKLKKNKSNGINEKNSHSVASKKTPELTSFFLFGHDRRAILLHNWSRQFLEFMRSRYGLESPWESISIVAVEADYEQVDILNNLILVPLPNYKRSKFLDRQALGFLTRRLAQLWFGESIFNDNDKQLWLNMGLPAFFGLRFYQEKFGPESGIFDTIDWLNPRYRDHFFEEMANSVSGELNYPILSSFRKNRNSQVFLKTLTYKTALVLSMLEYLLGKNRFTKGLQHFTKQYHGKLAGQAEFQDSMEKINDFRFRVPPLPQVKPYNQTGSGSLDWFFAQWFKTNEALDYGFETSNTNILPDGTYETKIVINKKGNVQMPVVVALKTKDGQEFRKILSGIKQQDYVLIKSESPPDKISIDPDEVLLESSRINNHSFIHYRIRLGADWKKQREHLVLLVPGFGNNALDGNSFGLGIKYRFDDYRLYAIPGYGTKNRRGLYILNFDRENLGINGLEAGFSAREYGGLRSEAIRATFKPPHDQSELEYQFHSSLSRETLFSADDTSLKGEISESGELNTFLLEHTGGLRPSENYQLSWNIWNEQPWLELDSDFSYVRWQGTLGQKFHIGHRKLFQLDIIHGTTSGITPLQKKFQLGSPSVLRGYPQHTVLSDERLLASRIDYKFPLVTAPFWGIVSAYKIQGTIFYDQGKIWSKNNSYDRAKHRQNAGFGIEWTVDTASLFQVPLKIEVAYPLNDREYEKPQFILLGILTGS